MINERMLEILCLRIAMRDNKCSNSKAWFNMLNRYKELLDEFVKQYELPEIDPNSVKNDAL